MLELPLVAVVNQVHARIHIPVMHPGEGGDAGAPAARVVADEVVCLARQLLHASSFSVRVGTGEPHSERHRWPQFRISDPGRAGICLPQLQDRLVAGEEQRVAAATRQESHLRIGLPAVLLEVQRQPPVVAEQARPIRARGGRRRMSLPGAAGLTASRRDAVERIYQQAHQSTQECPCRKRNISSPQLTPRMAQGARKKGGKLVLFAPSGLTSCNTCQRPCQTKTVGWGFATSASLASPCPRFRRPENVHRRTTIQTAATRIARWLIVGVQVGDRN
jgi:hypothetical protein